VNYYDEDYYEDYDEDYYEDDEDYYEDDEEEADMTPKIQYTLVGTEDGLSFISVFVPGRAPLVADSTHPNFEEILLRAEAGDPTAADLFDIALVAGSKFEKLTDRVSAASGRLFFDGDEVRGALATQVVRFLQDGVEDWKPLVNFFERVQDNPEEHSREQLFDWLAAEEFTINENGTIVGYKGVALDGDGFKSINTGTAMVNGEVHTGAIPQKVGDVVEMPRSAVAHDPAAACSVGLHVGTYGYAESFARGALLEVEVDPRDVVSVPSDCGGSKMRTCRYKVVGVVQEKYEAPVKESGKKKKAKKGATVADRICKVLKRGPKKGLTAAAIADRAGLKPGTTRTTLTRLKADGAVRVVGTDASKGNLYAAG
jgi:hypothetical protein